MTSYALLVWGNDGSRQGYISKVDLEVNGPNYPTGSVVCTEDEQQALRFPSVSTALAFIDTSSKTCPLRPDGKPNRPLRKFNIEFIPVEEQK